MADLVTLPSATTTYDQISTWSGATFDNLYHPAMMGVGFVIGGMILAFIVSIIFGAAERFFEGLMEKLGMGSYRGGMRIREHNGQRWTDSWVEKNY